jgi:hypothetical protein
VAELGLELADSFALELDLLSEVGGDRGYVGAVVSAHFFTFLCPCVAVAAGLCSVGDEGADEVDEQESDSAEGNEGAELGDIHRGSSMHHNLTRSGRRSGAEH